MIEKLAYSLGRNDEKPNIDLALELVKTGNTAGIDEIAEGLNSKTEQIANNCIKVLYEIGEREPELISGYVDIFIKLLRSKNNRLVWGAMTALSRIASLKPREIFNNLDAVLKAKESGSVITVDNSISVLAELAKSSPEYEKKVFPVIIKHLQNCRPKEVGQHSERAFICVTKNNSATFRRTLQERYDSLSGPQKKRVDKLLKRIDFGVF